MVQLALFAIMIVLTPFVVVTNYVQGLAHILSHFGFTAFDLQIPYILVIAVITGAGLLIWQRKNITPRKVKAVLAILILITIAHSTMDIYLGLSFFDLQVNWHYFAYCAYVFFFFRAFHARNMSINKMVILAYFSAVVMSVFDETFQYFMSDRVFDISDIAKDTLGVYIGLLVIFFVTETYGTFTIDYKKVFPAKIVDLFCGVPASLLTLGVFTMSFIFISPLFTEYAYLQYGVGGSFLLFILLMAVILLGRKGIFRVIFPGAIALILIGLMTSIVVNRKQGIDYRSPKLIIYRGIPLPFFDFVIYPDNYVHLIDKKKHFRNQDIAYMLEQKPDILLIGAGSDGSGGSGFDKSIGTHFIFNRFISMGTQVIILPTPEACETYNRLKKEKKKVLFNVHNN